MTAEKIKTTSNGLSIVFSNLEGKIIATANTAEIANEIVRRWNYAESLAKERAVEVLREMINKKKAEFESLKESAPHSNDSMRSCRIGIVTLLSAIEEMNDTFFAEKRKEGAE